LGAEAMLGQGEGETFLQLELQEDDSDDDFQINENAASSFARSRLTLDPSLFITLFSIGIRRECKNKLFNALL
jgi:hypothetical protein